MKEQSSLAEERAEIYLRLEQYSDIFSDFDMRPFGRRALSIDFLEELKRAATDADQGGIELMLHIPEKDRNESEEEVIKERLAVHFKKHFHLLSAEKRPLVAGGRGRVVIRGFFFFGGSFFFFFKNPPLPPRVVRTRCFSA